MKPDAAALDAVVFWRPETRVAILPTKAESADDASGYFDVRQFDRPFVVLAQSEAIEPFGHLRDRLVLT